MTQPAILPQSQDSGFSAKIVYNHNGIIQKWPNGHFCIYSIRKYTEMANCAEVRHRIAAEGR